MSYFLINTTLFLLALFLPASQPVVLVVFHHTFDVNYVAPDSKLSVKKDGVFAVDILFHEDDGLLNGLHNDKMLKSTTDYLISKGASPDIQVSFEQLAKKTVLQYCTNSTSFPDRLIQQKHPDELNYG